MTDPLPGDALAIAPDLPEATAGVVTTPAAPPAPAPGGDLVDQVTGGGHQVDRKGTHWSHLIHESPPRRNKQHCWAKLRGNAALRAQGKPLGGFLRGKTLPPPEAPPVDQVEAPAPPPDAASDLRWDDAPSGPVLDGVPAPELAQRPLEAYRSMSRGVVLALFGTLRILFGPAWKPEKEEQRAHQEAMQELLHEMQVTPVGGWFAVGILWIDSVAMRVDDAMTKARASAIGRWIAARWTRQPQPIAAVREQAPPPAPAPRPRAEIDDDARMKAYRF